MKILRFDEYEKDESQPLNEKLAFSNGGDDENFGFKLKRELNLDELADLRNRITSYDKNWWRFYFNGIDRSGMSYVVWDYFDGSDVVAKLDTLRNILYYDLESEGQKEMFGYLTECIHTELFDRMDAENARLETDELPSLSELPDGRYDGYFYGWVLELSNGSKYKTNVGIRRSRKFSPLEQFDIFNGEIVNQVNVNCKQAGNEKRPLDELENGVYTGRWYAYTLELEDGSKYETNVGVLRSRELTPLERYNVFDGNITPIA